MLEARVDRIEAALARLAEAQARTDEQLALLSEAQRRTEERVDKLAAAVDALAEAQRRTEARVEELAQALLQLSARVDALTEAQRRTEERVDKLAATVDTLVTAQRRTETRVGSLQGAVLEGRYRDRAPAYFGDLLRRIHALSSEELAELLDDAESRGTITPTDRRDLLQSDVVVRGLRRDSGELAYLVVEVSIVVDEHDVERAVRRAELLAHAVKRPAIPVVAGERLTPEAEPLLRGQRVWHVLDGRTFSPDEAHEPGPAGPSGSRGSQT